MTARLLGLDDTLNALDAALVEQAKRQREIANAIAVLAAHIDATDDPSGVKFKNVLGDHIREKIYAIFYAGEGL